MGNMQQYEAALCFVTVTSHPATFFWKLMLDFRVKILDFGMSNNEAASEIAY